MAITPSTYAITEQNAVGGFPLLVEHITIFDASIQKSVPISSGKQFGNFVGTMQSLTFERVFWENRLPPVEPLIRAIGFIREREVIRKAKDIRFGKFQIHEYLNKFSRGFPVVHHWNGNSDAFDFGFFVGETNVGPQLSLFGILRGAQLADRDDDQPQSQQRIDGNADTRAPGPYKCLFAMFGVALVGGLILCCKGIYRSNEFMIFGGWLTAAVGLSGVLVISLGHCSVCAPPRYCSIENISADSVVVKELKFSDWRGKLWI
jgi:hypothetical protein